MSDADQDLDLDLDDEDLDGSSDADDDGPDAPQSKETSSAARSESKRVSDLMSKWQAAEARAKKAEDALAKAGKQGSSASDGSGDEIPEQVRRWMDAAKEGARERWYNSDPRFAAYGLEQALIEGADPEAMQASAKRLAALIDSVESKARQKVLDEHGLTPEFAGSTKAPTYDFASMSDEDFAKFLAKRG